MADIRTPWAEPGKSIPARAQSILVYAPLNSAQLHWLGPVLEQALAAAVAAERERAARIIREAAQGYAFYERHGVAEDMHAIARAILTPAAAKEPSNG